MVATPSRNDSRPSHRMPVNGTGERIVNRCSGTTGRRCRGAAGCWSAPAPSAVASSLVLVFAAIAASLSIAVVRPLHASRRLTRPNGLRNASNVMDGLVPPSASTSWWYRCLTKIPIALAPAAVRATAGVASVQVVPSSEYWALTV